MAGFSERTFVVLGTSKIATNRIANAMVARRGGQFLKMRNRVIVIAKRCKNRLV